MNIVKVKYTPYGGNPANLTLTPPLVHDPVEFCEEKGHICLMPEPIAKKLIADNPRLFTIVNIDVPEDFDAEDLADIYDLDILVNIGSRFGMVLNKADGATKLRAKLLGFRAADIEAEKKAAEEAEKSEKEKKVSADKAAKEAAEKKKKAAEKTSETKTEPPKDDMGI